MGNHAVLKVSKQEEFHHADAGIRKQLIQQLSDQILVFPKERKEEERYLEIKGVGFPLTRIKLASPTGFEPVLPA